jgi:competence protein ComEC
MHEAPHRGHEPRCRYAGVGGRGAVPVAVALWLGLVLGARAPGGAWAWLAGSIALGALALRAPPRTGALFAVLAVGPAAVARGGAATARHRDAVIAVPAGEMLVRLEGVLDAPAWREGDPPVARLRVVAASPSLPRGAAVRLALPAGCDADWGDTLVALARVERFDGPRNPGGPDAAGRARASGLLARGRAFTAAVAAARGPDAMASRAAMRVRRAMERALASTLGPGTRELAAPLVFGDRSAMTPELDATLRGAGLVHLLALSGLHVAWLAAVARGLAALLRRGVRGRALAGAACAIAYAMLAGPLPSLARAVAGELAQAAARVSGRALDPVQSLALGVVALLVAHPAWTADLGFQLSCAATLGIVTLAAPLAGPFARRPFVRGLAAAMSVTLAAQLAALPVLLARVHALPWAGLVGNLAAVPVAELLLAAAWAGGLAEAALPGSGTAFLHACEPLAAALRAIAGAGAALPGAMPACGHAAAPVALAGAGVLLLVRGLAAPRTLADRTHARRQPRVAVAALGTALVACAIVAALAARPLRPPPGRWWLVAIDVGQGDALALAFEDGWWLVDAGPRSPRWDAGESAVVPFLRWAGVRSLSRLVLTHDDGDHTGGAAAVRRWLAVGETDAAAPRPGVPGPAARFGARALGRGDSLRARPSVRVLWPPRPGGADEPLAGRGDNAAAIVLEAGDGASRVLLMADADSLVEERIPCDAGVAVLKAGHHGSGSSSGAAFVARASPRRVLLSVGRHNAYGHPNSGALERLASTGATLDRTDLDGAIWYELGPDGVRRLDWRREEPGSVRRGRQFFRAAPAPAP